MGHFEFHEMKEVYEVHIRMLQAEVKNLKSSIEEQSHLVREQKTELQKLTNIHSEVAYIRHSLEGGTEFVEGSIVVRSNQEMVLFQPSIMINV